MQNLSLDQLHPHIWPSILQYCSLQDKKSLRLVNRTLLHLLYSLETDLKHVSLKRAITPSQLRQMATEVPDLLGLECCLNPKFSRGLDEAMENLVEKQANLKAVKITAQDRCLAAVALHDQGLSALLQLGNLTVLHLEKSSITGDSLPNGDAVNSSLSQLRVLNLSGCGGLTETGLNNLLRMCGNKLQGWKLMSCSHCREFCQQASWLLIGYTRVNNHSEAKSAS